jgi:hypothetical protein
MTPVDGDDGLEPTGPLTIRHRLCAVCQREVHTTSVAMPFICLRCVAKS